MCSLISPSGYEPFFEKNSLGKERKLFENVNLIERAFIKLCNAFYTRLVRCYCACEHNYKLGYQVFPNSLPTGQ